MAENQNNDEGYVSWKKGDDIGLTNALDSLATANLQRGLMLKEYGRSEGRNIRSFVDIDSNINTPSEYGRRNYEFFRPDSVVPTKHKEILSMCMESYESVGIVHKVIDMMADFGCQGIRLVHPQDSVEKFYRAWFDKVKMADRAERFLSNLYKSGNVITKKETGVINVGGKNITLPAQYTFLSPMIIEVMGGELSSFVGTYRYGLRIPDKIKSLIRNPKNQAEKDLVASLPDDVIAAANNGTAIYPLDPEKVKVYFYKKDDWDIWAKPMIYCILRDLMMYEKLKMTDLAACDTAISTVRLWTLGDFEHQILPKPALINKLSNILTNNVGGGARELIWGPDLKFTESQSQVYKYLGEEKYRPTLNAIYEGLGVPPSLTGGSKEGGFTNNFVSLKTLTERLEYGRSVLRAWLMPELIEIQKKMGFQRPADIVFDKPVMTDETSEHALVLQLVDRNIISAESVAETFGYLPEIEAARLKVEAKKREKGKMPLKAGPFHQSDTTFESDVKKIFAQQGAVTPSEVGVELEEKKANEKSPLQQKGDIDIKVAKNTPRPKPTGVAGQGRPKTKKDSVKRKQKVVKPRSKASSSVLSIWAKDAQDNIAEIVTGGVLATYGKKNIRSLTEAEFKALEDIKFGILCALKPLNNVNEESIAAILANKEYVLSSTVKEIKNRLISEYVDTLNKQPNTDNLRQIQINTYIELQETLDGDTEYND